MNEPGPPPLPEPPAHRAGPPPLPASSGSPAVPPVRAAAPEEGLLAGRLHPLTLVFTAWGTIRTVLIPLALLLLFGRKGSEQTYLLWSLGLMALPIGFSIARYFTFTYRIEHGELRTRHGILGRSERNIPLSRVQDVRIEQGMLHRLLGVAEVHVETAGGEGAEASLSVLARAEAERLRAGVMARMPDAAAAGAGAPEPVATTTETICALGVRDLLLAGLTSNHMASALVLVLIVWEKLDEILPRATYERWMLAVTQTTTNWVEQGANTSWVAVAVGLLAVILFGMLLSMVGSVVLFHGFTLSRKGEDLQRSYGLLTRRFSSLPRRRIQVLVVEESWLRRLFRLATLRADTAGSRAGHGSEGRGGRDVMLPIVPRQDIERLLPSFFPDLDNSGAGWRRVSRRAIRRGTVKGSLVCLTLAGISHVLQPGLTAWWPLALIPAVYGLNLLSYRRLGYWLGDRYFRTRRGWLSRRTHLVPIRNVQAVVVRQTPLDRWHRVATVQVDSAGQAYTGGGPHVENVAWAEALESARTLAHRAAATRYRWA